MRALIVVVVVGMSLAAGTADAASVLQVRAGTGSPAYADTQIVMKAPAFEDYSEDLEISPAADESAASEAAQG